MAEESADMQVTVKMMSGQTFTVTCSPSTTTAELKDLIAPQCGIPASQQRIVYSGKILKDAEELRTRGFRSGHTVHVVATSREPQQQQAAPPSTPTPATTQQQPASSPFGSLFGMPNPANGNAMDQEAMMQQMLQSPLTEHMLSNPDLMESLMMSNPQMRAVFERNPEMRSLMRDPSLIRESLRMMRDPALRREALRQQDRAMSNLEAMPGGFNHLRRLHADVLDPLYEATRGRSQQEEPEEELNPFDELLRPADGSTQQRPNSEALPNPWSSSPRAPSSTASQQQSNPFAGLFGSSPTGTTDSSPTNPFASMGMPGMGMPGMGMPGMGMPGMGMPGMGMPGMDPSSLSPEMLDMMESMLSMPGAQEMLRASFSPEMAQHDPRLAPILPLLQSNPQLMEQLTNPEVARQQLRMLRQMMGQSRGNTSTSSSTSTPTTPPPTTSTANTSSTTSTPPSFSPFGNFPGFPGFPGFQPPSPAPSQQAVDPAVRYASQQQQLQDMGFTDTAANLRALTATNGNVHLAVQRLLEQ
eukprot:m.60825 g.60825  ORF g.60825 m.60825 type:complete len:528 (+) comp13306_c1_seq1:219-1802(+)